MGSAVSVEFVRTLVLMEATLAAENGVCMCVCTCVCCWNGGCVLDRVVCPPTSPAGANGQEGEASSSNQRRN